MDRKTASIAKRFAKFLKNKLDAEKVILFGSRARGDHTQSSDFDFIIISKKFEKVPIIFRMSLIYDYWTNNIDVEALCFTPEEFKRKTNTGILKKALSEGIEI